MNRRDFVTNSLVGFGGLVLPVPGMLFPADEDRLYYLANRVDAPDLPVPTTARLPFGWRAFGVQNQPVTLRFEQATRRPAKRRPAWIRPALFRVSVAIDVREEKQIEVFLPQSGRFLGTLDIRYSPVFQPFQLQLSKQDVADVYREGLGLRQTKGESPVWFFRPDDLNPVANQGLLPHLFFEDAAKKPLDSFYGNFLSLDSVQSFGWMEGCVLDGLLDLHRRFPEKASGAVLDRHLNLFFDPQKNLTYEGPYSRPYTKSFYGIEALLPVAALAQLQPTHPILPDVADYCLAKADDRGLIRDRHTTTEGCYTLAYPLAALAVALGPPRLVRAALDQLLLRNELLLHHENIHQRMDEKGQLHYPNWARGVAWYLLGLVRTLRLLDGYKTRFEGFRKDVETLKAEFSRAATWAINRQDSGGLWFCFLDKPATGIDTSGSAGIAAALAIGVSSGYLPTPVHVATTRALNALLAHLTPDGFLTGAAQANKGGLQLQEGGYRVISQYASGLMAQLIAASPAKN